MTDIHIIGFIPARYGATRFPGKPLADLCGKPMIQWVYERALKSQYIQKVIVATDDMKIYDAVEKFGGECVLTNPECPSGTDRIAEAAHNLDFNVAVNIQGDEPMISPSSIDLAIEAILKDSEADITTAMIPICNLGDFKNPNIVKVVFDSNNYALYFSRSSIPSMVRVGDIKEFISENFCFGYKHLGLYVYRKSVLEKFSSLKPTKLEMTERLEQLRFLENGFKIRLVEVDRDSIGVDTPEDLERIKEIFTYRKDETDF